MVNESSESGDGEFKTSDVLITVLRFLLGIIPCGLSTDYSLSILHHFQDGY